MITHHFSYPNKLNILRIRCFVAKISDGTSVHMFLFVSPISPSHKDKDKDKVVQISFLDHPLYYKTK